MKLKFLIQVMAIALVASSTIFAAQTNSSTNSFPAKKRIPYLSPAKQAETFFLPEGYRLELVLSDPIIREPVVAAFDGDGRMFVAEMRTYMQNIDGKNEHTNQGRISLHWSTRSDGRLNKHTVFADKLLLPRMILPVADGLIVNETDSNDLWLYQDKNNDGKSDKKTKIYDGGKRGGNLEHQQSGLIWNLDNWLYMTVNEVRLRIQGTNVIKDPTPASGGQWGMAHDDYGKPWFVNGGGEIGPLHFQQPFIYGRFSITDELATGYRNTWPLIGLADVQGGDIRFRTADKTLNHLTAACGGEIFRGDRLPEDLRGDLLFAEPVGRMIRRTKIEVKDGVTYLSNAYENAEFIRSMDPNFRPVNLVTAPDGTLYIVDMYRGIIQEGNWVKEGSYLRKVVKQYQLEKNFGRGRIWRLVHDDFKPGPKPNLQNERPVNLVKYLEHPNGWWRDTAQKLLVLRDDKSVVPALVKMAQENQNHLARIHAIWTLEGLDALEPALIRQKLKDEHPQVRIAAIRASEMLCKKGDKSVIPDIQALASDPDPSVVIQVIMTAKSLRWTQPKDFIETTMKKNPAKGVQEIGAQVLVPALSEGRQFNAVEKKMIRQGEHIYNELCFTCHGPDGKGMPLAGAKEGVTMAPSLAGSKTATGISDHIINVLLKGASGPINGKTYDAQMVPMESNDDEWIASVASYVRNDFKNNASFIDTNRVAHLRATFKEREATWTIEELATVAPKFLPDRTNWVVTASHASDRAIKAIDEKIETRYETGKEQESGMWFQIKLPVETNISGIYLDAASSPGDYPRGYDVESSSDGKAWEKLIVKGRGNARTTEILFPMVKTRFLRITLTTAAPGRFWSIHEMQLLQPPDLEKIKTAAAKKGVASKFE